MSKLMCLSHIKIQIIEVIVSDYGFDFFKKKFKVIVYDYDFNLKSKFVVIDYEFKVINKDCFWHLGHNSLDTYLVTPQIPGIH